ncbi:MAG: Ig-like domain-containing protein [Gemmatimonadota bacterium]
MSAIAVTATIDTVMAVGRTTQLSASATDADGNAVSTSFTWSSSSAPVATMDGDGTVSAVGPGSVSIEASAEGEAGQWSVRVVDADLDGVTALLSDPFANALIESLDLDTESPIVELEADCDEALGIGDVLAIRTCLEGAVDVESAEAGSDPALAILDLFFQESLRKLRLDS